MIKEVPSKVFNAGLDVMIAVSNSNYTHNGKAFAYCDYYTYCALCPLFSSKGCCNGLDNADKICDYIIQNCVYEEIA